MGKHILLIGSSSNLVEFVNGFKREGITASIIERLKDALPLAEKEHFDGVVFVLPRYYDDVTKFVTQLRKIPGYESVAVLYLGSLIEGGDLTVLHQHGVKTLTLGPVPNQEVIRFIIKEL